MYIIRIEQIEQNRVKRSIHTIIENVCTRFKIKPNRFSNVYPNVTQIICFESICIPFDLERVRLCLSARINRTVKSTKNHDFSMTVLYDDGTYYFNIILLLQMCNALIQAFSMSKTAFYVSLHTSTILSNCILCLSAHQHVKMHTTLSCVPGISLKHSNIIYTHDEVSDRKRSG